MCNRLSYGQRAVFWISEAANDPAPQVAIVPFPAGGRDRRKLRDRLDALLGLPVVDEVRDSQHNGQTEHETEGQPGGKDFEVTT